MDKNAYAIDYLERSASVFRDYIDAGLPGLLELVEATTAAIRSGGKVLLFGNGGSAADAQHLAAEYVNRFLVKDRAALPAIALTTDTSILSAIGNDLGFDQVFSRQVEALAVGGDIALGLSTSGTSSNVLAGLTEARRRGCVTVGFCGACTEAMVAHCDLLISAPVEQTPLVQQFHITIGHLWVDLVEKELTAKS